MSSPSAIDLWREASQVVRKPRREPRPHATLRTLFWVYFWLLITEGILRKWILPSLSQPLLLIRDPIPLAVLWISIRDRVFPRTVGVYLWAALAFACVVAGLFVIPTYPQVVLYGLKCDFLHFTMLAVAPIVFDNADLDRIIRVVIYLSVPIALLMAWQFHAAPDAWINSGVDGTFRQIDSAGGHIRPPGPFSFTAGSVSYCALLAAVLTGAAVDRRAVNRPMLIVGAIALVVAALYSGSRGLVGSVAIVVATGMVGALAINPRVFGRYVSIVLVLGLVAVVLSTSSMLQDTVSVFAARVDNASHSEGGLSGFINRYFSDYVRVIPAMSNAPFAGYGLGVGTNGGASFLTGSAQMLLAESEWPRVVLESGPVLGLLFILFRMYLVVWMGWESFLAVRRGTVLAACLFGACAADVLNAHFGQATIVGFAMFTAGLTLTAATRREAVEVEHPIMPTADPVPT